MVLVLSNISTSWQKYLIVPKGVFVLPLSPNAPVADTNIPESFSLQLPAVCTRREGLDDEDLRPMVKTFRTGHVGQTTFDPGH